MKRGIFLLGLIIFSITAEVSTQGEVLEMLIITENLEELPLKLVETVSFVANKNLPLWRTVASGYVYLDGNVMNRIGKFRTYHDLDKSSAIIFFENWKCIYGVVDVRYTIQCLPLDQLRIPQIIGDSQYIIKISDEDISDHEKPLDLSTTSSRNQDASLPTSNPDDFNMLIKTFINSNRPTTSSNRSCKSNDNGQLEVLPSSSSADPPLSKRPRLQQNYENQLITVYPEILLFIPAEITSLTPQIDGIIMQYLIQFHAVAMLFAKLATHNIRIHINLAAIVLELADNPFPFTSLFRYDRPEGNVVLHSMTEYIKSLKNIQNTRHTKGPLFLDDSFDMFMLSTLKAWNEQAEYPGGVSTGVLDLMISRRLSFRNENKRFMGSVVDRTNLLRHYVNAAREIAHLMNVEDDPSNRDMCYDGQQCHAIMQVGNRHCPDCLIWSRKSINSFKQYLSENTNRCFLRNLPRSLHRFGYPSKTLIPADQCLCYGHMPGEETTHMKGGILSDVCTKKLQCGIRYDRRIELNNLLLPVDGTPCDENDNNKVCWRQRCVSAQFSIYRRS